MQNVSLDRLPGDAQDILEAKDHRQIRIQTGTPKSGRELKVDADSGGARQRGEDGEERRRRKASHAFDHFKF